MKRYIDTLKHSLLAIMIGLSFISVPAVAHAEDTKTAVCSGVGIASGSTTSDGCGDNGVDAMSVIHNVVQFIVIIIGVLTVVMIIVGGTKYITSGGDSNKTASAKNTIMYALIGVVIVLLAQGLVSFVLTTTEGVKPPDTTNQQPNPTQPGP